MIDKTRQRHIFQLTRKGYTYTEALYKVNIFFSPSVCMGGFKSEEDDLIACGWAKFKERKPC